MTKHTPGPWLIDEYNQIFSPIVEEYIAEVYFSESYAIPENEAQANAKLIAAAPELLEAVQDIHYRTLKFLNIAKHLGDVDTSDAKSLENKLSKIIAKALGENSDL